jgi:hypothetical protein
MSVPPPRGERFLEGLWMELKIRLIHRGLP